VSDELLTILRLCLLGLCYLFFFRVLRAVWVETRTPKTTAISLNSTQRLVITAPKQNAGRSYNLADEITLGRAAGCTITVDDDFVSQMHARVFQRADQIVVEDLGSTTAPT